jgi:hypothetical protein
MPQKIEAAEQYLGGLVCLSLLSDRVRLRVSDTL